MFQSELNYHNFIQIISSWFRFAPAALYATQTDLLTKPNQVCTVGATVQSTVLLQFQVFRCMIICLSAISRHTKNLIGGKSHYAHGLHLALCSVSNTLSSYHICPSAAHIQETHIFRNIFWMLYQTCLQFNLYSVFAILIAHFMIDIVLISVDTLYLPLLLSEALW